ncbi:MAG: hypothetical protein L0Z51_03025 [Candidatus Latescibacteria bacterium]|nr:hypothetical protein [Candidatus Latescibacterota bacterium]
MEYTDQQRAAFKDAYTKRFRKERAMLVLLFAVMVPFALTDDDRTVFGLSETVLGPIAIAAMVGGVIFSFRNWRCPACNKGLGRAFNPKRCRWCGIELRGSREARARTRVR